jgi:hypothetical protein
MGPSPSYLIPRSTTLPLGETVFRVVREIVDVVGKFDDEDDCYGWSNESYLPGKNWPRNPEFRLPKGRYIAKITIYSSGDKSCAFFLLENSVAKEHFRLTIPEDAEIQKVRHQD